MTASKCRGLIVAAGFSIWAAGVPAVAAQSAPAPAAPPPAAPAVDAQELDPSAPLAELPGLGVAWPDLSQAPAEAADVAAATAAPDAIRYT